LILVANAGERLSEAAAFNVIRLGEWWRGTDPGDPPAVYRDLVLDFARANDWHREGYTAKRAS